MRVRVVSKFLSDTCRGCYTPDNFDHHGNVWTHYYGLSVTEDTRHCLAVGNMDDRQLKIRLVFVDSFGTSRTCPLPSRHVSSRRAMYIPRHETSVLASWSPHFASRRIGYLIGLSSALR